MLYLIVFSRCKLTLCPEVLLSVPYSSDGFKSAITRWACGTDFPSVGGGVKRCFKKLEDEVVSFFCALKACDVDIAIRCTASRSCTMTVAWTDRGLEAERSD